MIQHKQAITCKARTRLCIRLIWAVLLLSPTLLSAQPVNKQATLPQIAIIIDDLGYTLKRDSRAIDLPGPVAYAFLPDTPHAKKLAAKAFLQGKEVLLHQPMESLDGNKLGNGGLHLNMTEAEVMQTVRANLQSIPHAIGINNHMGSLLTRHPGHMQWVMNAVYQQGNLFFIDSRTASRSAAHKVAQETQIPSLQRDIFLDTWVNPNKIRQQYRKLLKLARKRGYALAIGHPFPETINMLKKELPRLKSQGIELVAVSELVKQKNPLLMNTPTKTYMVQKRVHINSWEPTQK